VDVLIRNLKELNLDKSKLAELFEKLAAGELEAAEALLSEKKIKQEPASTDTIKETRESGASWQDTFSDF